MSMTVEARPAARRTAEATLQQKSRDQGVVSGGHLIAKALVRVPAQIAPALRRAREAVAKSGCSVVVNIWADPRAYAPGTKAQAMCK